MLAGGDGWTGGAGTAGLGSTAAIGRSDASSTGARQAVATAASPTRNEIRFIRTVPLWSLGAKKTVNTRPYTPFMAPKPKDIIWFIGRSSKRITVTVVGAAVVAAGVAMLALPGPGILVIALGFAILGTEYAWAAAAFERTKRSAEQAGRVAKGAAKSASGRIRKRPPGGGPQP